MNTRQAYYKKDEVVGLRLKGYDSLYQITEVKYYNGPSKNGPLHCWTYKLVDCKDGKPVIYEPTEQETFSEPLLCKAYSESWLTYKELIKKLQTTDFTKETEDE